MARKKKETIEEKTVILNNKFNIGDIVTWKTKDKPCEICKIMMNNEGIIYDIKVEANGHIYMHLVSEDNLEEISL